MSLRSLRPFDKKQYLNQSENKTSFVVDNIKSFGISSEISFISENILHSLKKKPMRLGIKELPLPSSRSIARILFEYK